MLKTDACESPFVWGPEYISMPADCRLELCAIRCVRQLLDQSIIIELQRPKISQCLKSTIPLLLARQAVSSTAVLAGAQRRPLPKEDINYASEFIRYVLLKPLILCFLSVGSLDTRLVIDTVEDVALILPTLLYRFAIAARHKRPSAPLQLVAASHTFMQKNTKPKP